VLTFDTETTVPDNATISSAKLILTVKQGNSETRRLDAFSIPISFDEPAVTWRNRKSGNSWSHAGVDVTGTASYAQVTSTPGSRVTFDVTQQVQNVINGKYGSRYARFVVRDSGASSRNSYKQYYSREASDATVRPTLVVNWGSASSSSTPTTIGPNADGDIILPASAATTIAGKWSRESMSGAIGGVAVRQPDAGAAKVTTALANPANYVEFRFNAEAGKGYRIWLHGHADRDSWANDSVYLQFSNSVTATGSATWRMGTTSSTVIVLEDCSGCGVSGWVWQDNGYGKGVLGPMVYFASSGPQTLRIQTREDGLALDEVILSPKKYASVPPSTPSSDKDGTPTGSTTTNALRVLQWNVHHGGVGTDGKYDPNRIASWVAQMKPDVISFNEVDTSTQATALAKAVSSATGVTWNTAYSGLGNMVLTRWSIENTSICVTNAAKNRKAAHVSLVVNGRQVNVWSTHLASDSQTDRISEAKALIVCEQSWPDARVMVGDFNMQVGSTEYNLMAQGHVDGWAAAASLGTAVHYMSCNGCTKNTRIDYIFSTKSASFLAVTSARVFDTRDSNGVMSSDHKPLVVVYAVK
jgi:endonuclease/exonuclease/phosphatase family metal-dependent hydrolase